MKASGKINRGGIETREDTGKEIKIENKNVKT